MSSWLQTNDQGVLVDVIVVPRASRTRAVGLHDRRLRVQLAAPPVDGEANRELVQFFADVLHTRISDVSIVSGETSKRKRVSIRGAAQAAVEALVVSR